VALWYSEQHIPPRVTEQECGQQPQSLCRGTVLHDPSKEGDFTLVVLKGEATVHYPGSRGRPDHVECKQIGDLIAPSQALSGPHGYTAICTEDSIILYMPKVSFTSSKSAAAANVVPLRILVWTPTNVQGFASTTVAPIDKIAVYRILCKFHELADV
jgi:hypothetical protein